MNKYEFKISYKKQLSEVKNLAYELKKVERYLGQSIYDTFIL